MFCGLFSLKVDVFWITGTGWLFTETLFFDAGHTGDLGNNIVAKRIFSDVLPIIYEHSKDD